MNICIVSSGDFFSDYGGGQVYVRNLVDELSNRSDVNTSVISFSANCNTEVQDYKGIKVYQVCDENTCSNALQQIRPDIVHANGEKLMTARLCKKFGIPCVVTAHHGGIVCPAGALLNTDDEICRIPADYSHCLKCYLRNTPTGLFWYPLLKQYSQERYCKIGQRLEQLPNIPFLSPIGRTGLIVSRKLAEWKELSETATHFIAPSNAIAEALRRNGCPDCKITVIPHGIPDISSQSKVHGFNNNKEDLNSQLSTLNFYYVGRINYIKGIHILLKAFSAIENPNIRLHLIGGAGNKTEHHYMKRLSRQYKRDTRIIWYGKMPSEQLHNTIKNFQCLVHPTICLEIFGLDIAEALVQNKFVIATRCGGAEMQIVEGSNGWLVKPNDAKEMQTAMQRYCSEKPQPSNSECKPIGIADHVESLMSLYTKCRQ